VSKMGERISKYAEISKSFPDNDGKTILPGEMHVYTVPGENFPKSVNFLCPCGCGRECYTPVCPTDQKVPNSRVWGFSRGPNGVTLTPSIRYLSGCRWHFNITDGAVLVHADSGKS
jgi:hypothetical protein